MAAASPVQVAHLMAAIDRERVEQQLSLDDAAHAALGAGLEMLCLLSTKEDIARLLYMLALKYAAEAGINDLADTPTIN